MKGVSVVVPDEPPCTRPDRVVLIRARLIHLGIRSLITLLEFLLTVTERLSKPFVGRLEFGDTLVFLLEVVDTVGQQSFFLD